MIRKKVFVFFTALTLAACNGTLNEDNVILINAFHVSPGQEEAALSAWRKARDFLKDQPGYLGTRLHQNIDRQGEFYFVNVARWRSAADFHAAIARMHIALPDNRVPGVSAHPGLFRMMPEESR